MLTPELSQELFSATKEIYIDYGDRQPPSYRLAELTADLRLAGADDLHRLWLMADLALDASQVSPVPELHISRAKAALETIVEASIARGGKEAERVEIGIPAILRLAELSIWGHTGSDTLPTNYDAQLDALDLIFSRYSIESLKVPSNFPSALIEILPIVLGQRHYARHGKHLWNGRFALLREEARENLDTSGQNWDIGLNRDPTAPLTKPEMRVQVKASKFSRRGGANRYRQDGIIPLNVPGVVRKNVTTLLMDCVREAVSSPSRILTSEDLELATARIDTKLREETALITALRSK